MATNLELTALTSLCTSALQGIMLTMYILLTVTLTLGEMSMCMVCWSYCLCLEVLFDDGTGPLWLLASRKACYSATCTPSTKLHT